MTYPPQPQQPWGQTGPQYPQQSGPYQVPNGYQPPPGYRPQPFRPQKKKTPAWMWLVIVAAVLVWFAGCAAFLAGGDTSSDTATSPAGKNVAAVGSAVRDGQFEFKVTAVDPPTSAVGSGSRTVEAKGEFIVVSVDITNTGNEPRNYNDSSQKLIDDQGREFANDSTAVRRLDSETWEPDLNPGFTISVKLAFDVPAGTVPTAIEFHDSMFSGGAKVALR